MREHHGLRDPLHNIRATVYLDIYREMIEGELFQHDELLLSRGIHFHAEGAFERAVGDAVRPRDAARKTLPNARTVTPSIQQINKIHRVAVGQQG